MQDSPNSTESVFQTAAQARNQTNPSSLLAIPCVDRFALIRHASTSIVAYTFLGILNIVLAALTVFANCLMLHALSKCKSLYTPIKASFSSLAVSDLGVGLFTQPLLATYCFAVVSNNVGLFCTIQSPYNIVAYALTSVSFLTITVIAVDRFYAFKLGVRYRHVVTFKRVVPKLLACWMFGIVWPFTWLLSEKVAMFTALLITFCCVVMTSGSSTGAYCAMRRHLKQNHQYAGNSQTTTRRYKKLLDTIVLIFCLLLVCCLPYFIVVGVEQATESNSNTMLALKVTCEIIYLNSLLNPILYCWRMREIRREVSIVLPCFASRTYEIRPGPKTENNPSRAKPPSTTTREVILDTRL